MNCRMGATVQTGIKGRMGAAVQKDANGRMNWQFKHKHCNHLKNYNSLDTT